MEKAAIRRIKMEKATYGNPCCGCRVIGRTWDGVQKLPQRLGFLASSY